MSHVFPSVDLYKYLSPATPTEAQAEYFWGAGALVNLQALGCGCLEVGGLLTQQVDHGEMGREGDEFALDCVDNATKKVSDGRTKLNTYMYVLTNQNSNFLILTCIYNLNTLNALKKIICTG